MLNILIYSSLAHRDAYERAEILHRDISDNNIMIGEDGHGLLTDWDCSKYRHELGRQADRSVSSFPSRLSALRLRFP